MQFKVLYPSGEHALESQKGRLLGVNHHNDDNTNLFPQSTAPSDD